MLHLLLLLSSDGALIGWRPLDRVAVVSGGGHTRCVHGRCGDAARLLAYLRLSHRRWIVLLL